MNLPLGYTPGLRPLFTVLGIGPARSGVRVDPDAVTVRMGWGFRVAVPRTSVRHVAPDGGPVGGWGVHGWGGRWLVNGSSAGLVRFEVDPPAPGRVLGVPVRIRVLRVSLEQPAELVALLTGRPAA